MSIQRWNEQILLVQPQPEPNLTEELREVYSMVLPGDFAATVIIDLHDIGQLNSSHLSLLLKLRRALAEKGRSLILCSVPAVLWGVFLVTGLDTVFAFAADVMTALATAQLQRDQSAGPDEEAAGN